MTISGANYPPVGVSNGRIEKAEWYSVQTKISKSLTITIHAPGDGEIIYQPSAATSPGLF